MTIYRDRLIEDYGKEVGDLLDTAGIKLQRKLSNDEILQAVEYIKMNEVKLSGMARSARRQDVADFLKR